jgi:hypothetical protein
LVNLASVAKYKFGIATEVYFHKEEWMNSIVKLLMISLLL